MKTLLYFVTMPLFYCVLAKACPPHSKAFLCHGDKVVDQFGIRGNVEAINQAEESVVIKYPSEGTGIYQTNSIKTVAVAFGCLANYCVGDTVVTSQGQVGKIEAINSYNRTLAIAMGSFRDLIEMVDTVALGLGCSMGYCVGDIVFDPYNNRGEIIAINKISGFASVKFKSGRVNSIGLSNLASVEQCSRYGKDARSMTSDTGGGAFLTNFP